MANTTPKTVNTVKAAEPKVSIFIPKQTDELSNAKIDNTEHVTINGVTTLVQRGVHVDVPVSVFEVLKIKYPDL